MQTNSTTVPDHVNKFSFYDDPTAQMNGLPGQTDMNLPRNLGRISKQCQHIKTTSTYRNDTGGDNLDGYSVLFFLPNFAINMTTIMEESPSPLLFVILF